MKVYEFGADTAPVILLLPGTCCHWKSNFGQVIPLLQRDFRVLCVSYDGFDETESTEFPTMLAETEKIEAYILKNCGGHIRAAYGCSLGGSFVGLLAARKSIHMDYGILGSSDLDQCSKLAAKLQTNLPAADLSADSGRAVQKLLSAEAIRKVLRGEGGLCPRFYGDVRCCTPLCDDAKL